MSGRNRSISSERGSSRATGLSSASPQHRPDGASPQTDLTALQQSAGNRAVHELLKGGADDQSRAGANAPRIVQEVLRAPGQPLDPATRAIMEPRFGHDFGHVRVHSDAKAAESARAVDARAYTLGQDVVFSEGGYSPHSNEGSKLLAHELAHVIQQERGGASPPPLRGGALEQHADAAASAFAQGQPVHVQGASSPGVARQPAPGARESRPHLREMLKLDPRNPKDQQLGAEFDMIETLLVADDMILGSRYPWGDKVILEKAMELNKNTGGKLGGAVIAYYDRLVGGAVMGMLAQATTPVVKMTDPSGKIIVSISAPQLTQARINLERDFALGMLDGFAKIGLVTAIGMLAVEVVVIAAVAAPAVISAAGTASTAITEGGTALAFRVGPWLMNWAARNPYVAEATVTAVVDVGLQALDTGTIDPMQVVFHLMHIQAAPRVPGPSRTPTPSAPPEGGTPPPTTAPKVTLTPAPEPAEPPRAIPPKAPPSPPPTRTTPKAPPRPPTPAPDVTPPEVAPPPKAPPPKTPPKVTTPSKPAWNDPALTEDQAYEVYKNAGVKSPLSESEARKKINSDGWRFNPNSRRWLKPNRPSGRAPRVPTGPFMRDQLKKVSDPNHPLHNLVVETEDASGAKSYDWRRTVRETSTGKTQVGRYPGNEEGPVVQAGHEEAYAGGGTQRYMLEDADLNIVSGNVIESKGGLSSKVAVEVDGVRVDLASLQLWERLGVVPQGTVAKATATTTSGK
jgi:hypothetical protein